MTTSQIAIADTTDHSVKLVRKVFPSARHYRVKKGVFLKENLKRIYIIPNNNKKNQIKLEAAVSLISREFVENGIVKSKEMAIEVGDCTGARLGDIVVKLDKQLDEVKATDGFVIDIDGVIFVRAESEVGIMYALRTIIQYFYVRDAIPKGKIIDYPAVKERAVHIDIGRKYYSVDSLKNLIKQMSFCRLNTLQLHFSENEGFRLQCATYPEIMSDKYLTKAEVRQIIATAKRYGVTIIPSFDSPGHLRAVLAEHDAFWLTDKFGQKHDDALDINNDNARQFIKNIITEYAELFGDSQYFQIGGDEFIDFNNFDNYPSLAEFGQKKVANGVIANGLDGYMAYLNEMADYVRALGFIPRIWNDGIYRRNITAHIALDKTIQINYWSRWDDNIATTDDLIAKGHQLINTSEMMYYVLEDGVEDVPEYDLAAIYDHWHVGQFPGYNEMTQNHTLPNPNIVGACYAIWSEDPYIQTEKEVLQGIYYPLSAMAQKSWAGKWPNNRRQAFKNLLDNLHSLKPIKDIFD